MTKRKASSETAYVYVISRRDLPPSHLTVQACHATLAATNTFGSPKITHPYLVFCAVENESELTDLFESLKEQGVPCCAYYEDDMNNALTAVATAPLRGHERRPLRRLKLA